MLAKVVDCLADHLKIFLLYYNMVNTNHISYNEYFFKNIVFESFLIDIISKKLTIINKIQVCISNDIRF